MHLDHFHYSVLGTNQEKRIVFVHGLMAFSANWRKIANHLQDEYQCLIYDQRGHGRSFKPNEGYSNEDLASDLKQITEDLGWSKFHLVGHSMGARVSMVFAHQYPQKVQTLCLEDMGAIVHPNSYKYYENMLNIVPTPFATKEDFKSFFENKFLNLFTPKENPQVLVSFLMANIEEKDNKTYDWKFHKQGIIDIVKLGHIRDRWTELQSFQMPVLLVRGGNSHVLKSDEFNKMLEINSKIEGFEFEGVGHWVHYEKSQEFADLLRKFIQKNSLHDAQ